VPYLGFGLGAASFFSGYRWKNTSDIGEYLGLDPEKDPDGAAERLRTEVTKLSREDRMEEFMYLGLRCTEGVSAMSFLGKFGVQIDEIFGKPLEKNMSLGLMEQDGDRYRLTERGIDVSNRVLSEFLLEKQQQS
jgi:oxygen-independent coproporphyrinogen-3 oxidase